MGDRVTGRHPGTLRHRSSLARPPIYSQSGPSAPDVCNQSQTRVYMGTEYCRLLPEPEASPPASPGYRATDQTTCHRVATGRPATHTHLRPLLPAHVCLCRSRLLPLSRLFSFASPSTSPHPKRPSALRRLWPLQGLSSPWIPP